MKVPAWNNGQWHASGAGYRIKLRLDSRDKDFSRTWPDVKIRLEGNGVITCPPQLRFGTCATATWEIAVIHTKTYASKALVLGHLTR